jgi:type IV secretion system protein VirD4
MSPHDFTPHQYLKNMPRGFTIQAYERLEEAKKRHFVDHVPAQQTPTGGWFDLETLFQQERFRFNPNEGDRLYIGHLGSQPVAYDDDRHVMLTASSRSGKGISHILPNLIFYKGSMFCLDPKGELASFTARRRASGTETYAGLGQHVVLLDPFKITQNHVADFRAYYNVFEDILYVDAENLVENADLVADAIVVPDHHGDSHWNDTARNLIAGIILHLSTYPAYNPKLNPDLKDDPRHLVTVYELLMAGTKAKYEHGEIYTEYDGDDSFTFEGLEGLFKEMQLNQNQHVRFAALDIASKPPNEQGSVISTARRHLKFLSSDAMRDALMPTPANQGRRFKLEELKTNPDGLTIYICLPSIRLATHRAFFRLFVNLSFASIEQLGEQVKPAVKTKDGKSINTLFMLDEAYSMGKMNIITTAAPLFASYGCRMMFFFQDLNQLKTLYGDLYQSLMGNCGILLFYNNPDPFTLNFIETLLGKTSIVANRYGHLSLDAYAKGGQADTKSFETHPLLTGEEIRRHFARDKGNVLVITPEERPIVLKRIKAYESVEQGGLASLYDAG